MTIKELLRDLSKILLEKGDIDLDRDVFFLEDTTRYMLVSRVHLDTAGDLILERMTEYD